MSASADIPAVETLYQGPLQDLLTFINEFYNDLIDDRSQEIQDELSNIQGILDIDEKQEEIQNELQQKVDDDGTVKTFIIPTIERLLAELKKKVKDS
jgi:UDP-N-acetylglucosamine transferase subunit ALG13